MRGLVAVVLLSGSACHTPPAAQVARGTLPADSGFVGVQRRGAVVMGVDQSTSTHVFEDLADGGRIILDRDDSADTAAITTIRQHMRMIADDFGAGNFSRPLSVHAQEVPGTDVMAARRARITYLTVDRPRGSEVRIRTTDADAIVAIHRFLAFQRSEHHAMGHEEMMVGGMRHDSE